MPDRPLGKMMLKLEDDVSKFAAVAFFTAFLLLSSTIEAQAPAAARKTSGAPGQYVGSAACKTCHGAIYERWRKTRMANVITDPREHPEVIIPDLTKPDPLLKFTKDEIAFVYGTKWKQRYFKKVGDDYYPFPAQWDITHKLWRPYQAAAGTDWWVRFYPGDNFARPTGTLC